MCRNHRFPPYGEPRRFPALFQWFLLTGVIFVTLLGHVRGVELRLEPLHRDLRVTGADGRSAVHGLRSEWKQTERDNAKVNAKS